MKTLKTILSIFAMVAVFSAGAYAQDDAVVNAAADVVASLTVAQQANVGFGTIETGTASYLKANSNDGTTESNLGTTASAGEVTVSGASGTNNVVVSWNNNVTLANSAGDQTIAFTPTVYFGSVQITDGGTMSLTGGTDLLEIGGSLAAASTTEMYSTSNTNGVALTITVQYN